MREYDESLREREHTWADGDVPDGRERTKTLDFQTVAAAEPDFPPHDGIRGREVLRAIRPKLLD
jgi:hypothetical protein